MIFTNIFTDKLSPVTQTIQLLIFVADVEITGVTKPSDLHFIQDTAYSLTASGPNMFSVEVTNNGPDVISSVLGSGV